MYWSWEVAFDVLPQLAKGVIITVEATIVASLLAYVLGLGIAILKMSKSKLLRVVLYWITEFIRRRPILVQLFIVFYVLPDYGIFFEAFTCGVIVLGVHFSTYTSEVFRAGIDNVSKGQWEAFRSLGITENTGMKKIVLPQALPAIIPGLTSQYLNLAKNSTLAIAVGYADIYAISDTTITQTGRAIEIVSITMLTYLSLSISISILMNWYNKKIAIKEK